MEHTITEQLLKKHNLPSDTKIVWVPWFKTPTQYEIFVENCKLTGRQMTDVKIEHLRHLLEIEKLYNELIEKIDEIQNK